MLSSLSIEVPVAGVHSRIALDRFQSPDQLLAVNLAGEVNVRAEDVRVELDIAVLNLETSDRTGRLNLVVIELRRRLDFLAVALQRQLHRSVVLELRPHRAFPEPGELRRLRL